MLGIKVGMEKEFFVVDDNGAIQPLIDLGAGGDLKSLPADECGWLAEARSRPYQCVVEAAYSLKASMFLIEKQLESINKFRLLRDLSPLNLSDSPIMPLPSEVRVIVSRHYAKPLTRYQNFYGHLTHRNALSEATAGLHVSLTVARTIMADGTTRIFNTNFDWPYIFRALDVAFEDEIRAAKRKPGFYEVKADGRVEHRSLPANVDIAKLIDVLSPLLK